MEGKREGERGKRGRSGKRELKSLFVSFPGLEARSQRPGVNISAVSSLCK